jgi:segregation and condensation protein B
MDQQLVTRIVEAALLAANQPLSLAQLHALLTNGELSLDEPAPEGSVERALETLREACADRGVELVEVASGFRYQVKADVHAWVARLWTERKTKYTRATLETLALIAYRQPITRGEIEQVRGVAVSSNIIQALEEREWIRVVGHRDVPGKPALYGTTKGFLDYFGLKRLDELPPLSELKDIGELEPQLQFDGEVPVPVGGIAEGDGGTPSADAMQDETTPTVHDDETDGQEAMPADADDEATSEPRDDTDSQDAMTDDSDIAQHNDNEHTDDDAELASSEQTQ